MRRSPEAATVGRLADLPEQRREALLRHFAYDGTYGGLDYDGVDDLVREPSTVPCLRRRRAAPEPNLTTALGSDGHYHLFRATVPVCAGKPRRGDGGYLHEQAVHWWVTGTGCHPNPRPGGPAARQGRVVRWQVELLEVGIDPALVAVVELVFGLEQRAPVDLDSPLVVADHLGIVVGLQSGV